MLLSTAFLQPSTYASEPEGYKFGLKLASELRDNNSAFTSVIQYYIASYEDTRTPALYINIPNVAGKTASYTYPAQVPLSSLRDVEQEIVVF